MAYRKSFEQIRQEKIDKAVKNKERHYTKTELSILVSWAINNAVNTLPKTANKEHWGEDMKKAIIERYPWFIELYREWMMDNLPVEYEPISPTQSEAENEQRQDYKQREKVGEDKVKEANLSLSEETENE